MASNLDAYKAYMNSIGANMSNWEAALADTKRCAAGVTAKNKVDRMIQFIDCRRGKKVAKA